jgi:hypothetical protein
MFRPSSRDLSLVGSLLPLFAREITADPEQHNRARREARVRDYKEIGRYVNQSNAEAERRQDDELRTRLDGESERCDNCTMADHHRRESCRPIEAAFRSCCTANITGCTKTEAYREAFRANKSDSDTQHFRTRAASCNRQWSKSVHLVPFSSLDKADDIDKASISTT